MLNWCIELYVPENGKLVNPCGMDWTVVYHDLKTLAGVKRRIAKWSPLRKMSREVVEIRIYSYAESNKYNRDKWRLSEVICGWDLISLLDKQDYNFEKAI